MKLSEALRVSRSNPSALLLVGVNMTLAVLLAITLFSGTEVDSLLATPDQKISSALIDWQPPPSAAVNFDVIQSQPLFHSSRMFYVPPDPAAGLTMTPPPDYRVAGAMALPNKPVTVFLVHNQSSERAKVQKGDVLEGWAVEEASNKLVVLSMNGRRAELTAGKPSGVSTPVAQSSAVPAVGAVAGAQTGLQKVSLASTTNAGSTAGDSQGGVRILSGGSSRAFSASTSNAAPKPSPEDIGVRLYRPPPTQ